MKKLFLLLFLVSFNVSSQELNPVLDYRYTGEVTRDANGEITRSIRVLNAFKKMWACPSTKLHFGACPRWAIDHVIPRSCGGVDAVYNLQWLPLAGKSCKEEYCKDRYERIIYGGNEMSEGCP